MSTRDCINNCIYPPPLSGRGVFALVPFIKGDFVVEYRGEMITLIEAELRREANQDTFFMFDFIWQNKKWWYIYFFLSIHFKITIKKIKKSNFLFVQVQICVVMVC